MIQESIRNVVISSLLLCALMTPGVAQVYTVETIPNPKQSPSAHYVSNPDHILSNLAVHQINSLLARLEDSTTAQVAVVCVNSIGENVPKDLATALFRKWGLGYRQKNNGLLILLVKDQHRIEMETGYGLEGILPDALCYRIQARKMIPLAKAGNYDGAMLTGVGEIARLISDPEAVKEVYDKSKYQPAPNQPLDNSGVFVLFLLLIPCLLTLRLLSFFVRRRNPVADEIETTISQTKGRLAWAFLLYIVMPVCLGFIVIKLRSPLALHGWQIVFILYAYTGTVLWEGRRRRKNTFTRLFGTMTDPEQYVRQKAAGLNSWFNMLLFPIPFAWLGKQDEEALEALRYSSRKSADGYELTRVDPGQEEVFLTDYQKVEQTLGTVDYDIWHNDTHDSTLAVGYENLADATYYRCDKCRSKTMYLADNRILKEATSEREGRGCNEYMCKACGHHREVQYVIAIRSKSPASTVDSSSTTYSSSGSSSSSSWSGSSGSSSGSSSWGGGSSGGGGAGSSW